MKAISITPGKGEPHFIDIPEPQISNDYDIKLETLQVGICGTDRAEISGGKVLAEPGRKELVIGHEMLGRVVETGAKVTLAKPGELGLFTVRRGCGKCYPCQHERNDMCETGDYSEHGIKGIDGFQAEFIVDEEKYFIKIPESISSIGVLVEPMSIVEKAIDQALDIQKVRLPDTQIPEWPKGVNVLIAGLGPVGLLAAIILKIKGVNLYGLDIVENNSPRAMVIKQLEGTYINGKKIRTKDIDDEYGKFELVFEATGITKLEFQLVETLSNNGVYMITGIPEDKEPITILGGELMKNLVLNNQIFLGSVNAAPKHYRMAVDDLLIAQRNWPDITSDIITEKVSVDEYTRAFTFIQDEIKTVIVWRE